MNTATASKTTAEILEYAEGIRRGDLYSSTLGMGSAALTRYLNHFKAHIGHDEEIAKLTPLVQAGLMFPEDVFLKWADELKEKVSA